MRRMRKYLMRWLIVLAVVWAIAMIAIIVVYNT
jgi:hypothetical protein